MKETAQTKEAALDGFYDRFWASRRNRVNHTQRVLARSVLTSLKEVRLWYKERPRILELGCGTGWLASRLAKVGAVTAIDSAEQTVRANQKAYPHVDFFVGDVTSDMGFHATFDAVVCMEVVEHIPYARQPELIREAHRALRSGGFFIMTTPNKGALVRLRIKGFQPVEDVLSMEEAKELVSRYFVVEDCYTAVNAFKPSWLYAIWKRLFYPVDLYLVQRWIRYTGRGKHIVVVGRKG